MRPGIYITLVSSLPALPALDAARRLPINEARLWQRLRMLSEDDHRDLAAILDLVRWKELPLERTDDDHAARYEVAMLQVGSPLMREHLRFRMDRRTVLAALRHRVLSPGEAPPVGVWGTGDWPRRVEANWQRSDFGLGIHFPWVEEARGYLERGESLQLERMMLRLVWQGAQRLSERAVPFSFEQVCAYVLRWDVLSRYLSYQEGHPVERFRSIVEEVSRARA